MAVTAEQCRIAELEAQNAELRARNAHLGFEAEELRVMVERLTSELDALKALLGKDSSNSSIPPSRDDQASHQNCQARRAASRSQRKAAGRRPGKQPGSPGSSLSQRAEPDVVVPPPSRRLWRLWRRPG